MNRSVYSRQISGVRSVLKASTTTISSHQRRLSRQSRMRSSSLKHTTIAETVGIRKALALTKICFDRGCSTVRLGFRAFHRLLEHRAIVKKAPLGAISFAHHTAEGIPAVGDDRAD